MLQKSTMVIVQPPEKFGVPLKRWSMRELSAFLQQRHGWEMSPASIGRFLRSLALEPHRVRYWLSPTDPDFERIAAKICKLYVNPHTGKRAISINEKPGVHVLRRLHPARPTRPGKPARLEFEYERKGMRNLSAAFPVRSGQVLVWATPDRSTPWVSSFLDQILKWVPRGPIVLITDNSSTRTRKATAKWLSRHPRVEFTFTPKHGSWRNQVELWFGILTSEVFRHRSFSALRALDRAIYRFARYCNEPLARPFEWTYTGKVLAA